MGDSLSHLDDLLKQLILSDGMRFVVVFKCHCFKAQDSQILWF